METVALNNLWRYIETLPEDWDDEGALPIFPSVVENTKVLLDASSDSDLAHWNLFPAVNGTLTFQHEKLDAMLSIGEEDYSFVFSSNGVIVKAVDHDTFSMEEILGLMRMVEEQKYAQ